MEISILTLIELTVDLILVLWVITATVRSLKRVAPVPEIKHLGLMKGIWKLEIALGFSLCGLAGLGIFAAIHFPSSFGALVLLMTLGVFMLTYQATKELEMVPTIAGYVEKVRAGAETRK